MMYPDSYYQNDQPDGLVPIRAQISPHDCLDLAYCSTLIFGQAVHVYALYYLFTSPYKEGNKAKLIVAYLHLSTILASFTPLFTLPILHSSAAQFVDLGLIFMKIFKGYMLTYFYNPMMVPYFLCTYVVQSHLVIAILVNIVRLIAELRKIDEFEAIPLHNVLILFFASIISASYAISFRFKMKVDKFVYYPWKGLEMFWLNTSFCKICCAAYAITKCLQIPLKLLKRNWESAFTNCCMLIFPAALWFSLPVELKVVSEPAKEFANLVLLFPVYSVVVLLAAHKLGDTED